jgi:energy-converting hydrogenase A subunit R
MEYNHMEELGFSEDKQALCTASGFLSSGNAMKRMCDRFIRNGGRVFDVLTAYDNIQSYGMDRSDRSSGDAVRTMMPLLKANGVTDTSMQKFFVDDMSLIPGSNVIHHINDTMPTMIISECYEHHSVALCDALKLPSDSIKSTEVSFDSLIIEKKEARTFREYASELAKLDVPKITSNDEMSYLDGKDQGIIETVEEILENMNDADIMIQADLTDLVGSKEKVQSVMEMRRRTGVDWCDTAYIGNNATDHTALDNVRKSDGLALSFNGDGLAVRGSNVAVMSPNSIAVAVILSEFYTAGIEGVFSLISSWDREKLAKKEFSDRHLMNAMLNAFPIKLPEAVIVDDDNVDDMMKHSERYRRKLNL